MVDYETCHKECTAVFMSGSECIFKKMCVSAKMLIERKGDKNE